MVHTIGRRDISSSPVVSEYFSMDAYLLIPQRVLDVRCANAVALTYSWSSQSYWHLAYASRARDRRSGGSQLFQELGAGW